MALIKWQEPSKAAFDAVAEDAQVMVFYFGDRADEDQILKNADVDGLVVAKSVVCIRIPVRPEISADTVKATSVIPTSPLLSADLWKAYGVTQADSFVVTDRYGNKMATETTGQLLQHVNDLSKHFRGIRKDIRKLTKSAQEAVDAKDTPTALKNLHEAFAFGIVGYKECEEAETLYASLMDAARAEVTKAATDADQLKSLAKVYAGSDIAKEIDAALGKLEAPKG